MKKMILGFALFLIPLGAFAMSPAEFMTLVTNSGSVRQKAIDVEIQRLSVNRQWMDYLPDLQFQYTSAYSSIFTPEYDATHNIGLTSEWSLLESGTRYLEHSIGRLELEGAMIDYRISVQSALSNALSLLLDALKAREEMNVAVSNEILLKYQRDMTEAKYKQGSVSEIDRLTSEADYQNALYEKKKTQMLADKALADLARNIGTNSVDLDDWKTLFGSELTPISASAEGLTFTTVTKQSNLICIEELNKVSAIKNRWLPSVSLSASLDWQKYNYVASKNTWSNQSMEPRIDLSVRFPIFEQGTSTMAIKKEELLIDQKKIELSTLTTDSRAGFELWVKDHNDRLELLEVARKRAASSYLSARKALESYQLGAKSLLDWLDAEKTLHEAQISLLDDLYKVWGLRLAIGGAMGDCFLYLGSAPGTNAGPAADGVTNVHLK